MIVGRRLRATASVVASLAAAGASLAAATAQPPAAPLEPAAPGAEVIDGAYLVGLDEGAGPAGLSASAAAIRGTGAEVTDVLEVADAVAVVADPSTLDQVRRLPGVAYVEPDVVVRAADTTTQTAPGWGLDRIDERARPLDNAYRYDGTGAGVRIYVLDGGVSPTHTQLAGRVSGGWTAIADGRGTGDCDGHGTAVAGVSAGTLDGVAKGASVVPVRVLDCQGAGTLSGIVAGIDWVRTNRVLPAVANLSLGGSASTTIDRAVSDLVGAGVVVVAAAGNGAGTGGGSGVDACTVSPARAPAAVTVAATTSADARAAFSNFGTCVDLFAPGDSITAPWPFTSTGGPSTTSRVIISGTSFSAPYVAGAAALVLQDSPAATPDAVLSTLASAATVDVVADAGAGSANRLLLSPLVGPVTTRSPLVVVGEPTVDELMTALASATGAFTYIPSAGPATVTTRSAVPGCTGLARPTTTDLAMGALLAAVTGTPSPVSDSPYGSTSEHCVDVAAVVGQ